jgi:hypothetical protein
MNIEQFQNQLRLYLIGALGPEELAEFQKPRKKLGRRPKSYHQLLPCMKHSR